MTPSDLAVRRLHQSLAYVPGSVEIEANPVGLDVTIEIPPWHDPIHWTAIAHALANVTTPQFRVRVTVTQSWSAALGSALFALAALGIAVAGVYVAVWL